MRDITQSSDGLMWLAAEDGLYSFDGYHLIRRPFMEDGKERRGMGSYNMVEDKGDSLLVVTQKTILSFNRKDFTYRIINDGVKEDFSGFMGKPTCSLQDGYRTWVGTARTLQLKENGTIRKEWAMPVVKCLSKTQNEILVGTDNGLFVIDMQSLDVNQHVMHDTRRDNSLSGDAVWCMYSDRDRNVWIGTNCGVSVIPYAPALKIYRLSDLTSETRGNQIYVAFSDHKNRLWLGGTNGLLCMEGLDSPGYSYRWYMMGSREYPLSHNRVRTICETSKDHSVIIGGDGGMWKYNEVTKQFDLCKIGGMSSNWIYEISQMPHNKLYIATFDASYIIDEDNMSEAFAKKVKRQNNTGKTEELLRQYGLEDKFLTAYDDGRNNRVILGGTDVFAILDKGNRETTDKSVLMVTDIKVNGDYYLPHSDSFSDNSFSLNKDTKVVEVYFTDFNYNNSLPVSYLYSIDDGQTWISCNNGSLLLNNLSSGNYRIILKSSDSSQKLLLTVNIASPWYATWWAYGLYLCIVILIIAGILYIMRQRRRIREREELLQSAREKEQALISENEHLSNQLHVQLLQAHNDDTKEELSEDERLLLNITTIIEENMSGELDVNTLSQLSGIHSKQLYRKIKEMTGMTTVAYIRDLRLKKAATLLAKRSFSVAEVMYRVGFSNPSYFTKCFQEEYGITPSEYIKNQTT